MDIKAIEIGWGTDSTYYSTTDKEDSPYYVERITEQPIVIAGNMILSYVGFRDGRQVLTQLQHGMDAKCLIDKY